MRRGSCYNYMVTYIVEVDQSGKIEDTSRDTVLALANGVQLSLIIPAVIKRECVHTLRESGVTGQTLYLQFFATALFFLLRNDLSVLPLVIIDIEYTGKDAQIKQHLYSLLQRAGFITDNEQIQFGYVGKKSPAHVLALSVFRGQKEADLTLTTKELLKEFGLRKKMQRRSGAKRRQ
ncbi:MAG TPA: hypothetical protein VJ183_00575 [Chloroflexia bacterium]|nr:hypothetical protein [Chloroflexia bacterium]